MIERGTASLARNSRKASSSVTTATAPEAAPVDATAWCKIRSAACLADIEPDRARVMSCSRFTRAAASSSRWCASGSSTYRRTLSMPRAILFPSSFKTASSPSMMGCPIRPTARMATTFPRTASGSRSSGGRASACRLWRCWASSASASTLAPVTLGQYCAWFSRITAPSGWPVESGGRGRRHVCRISASLLGSTWATPITSRWSPAQTRFMTHTLASAGTIS